MWQETQAEQQQPDRAETERAAGGQPAEDRQDVRHSLRRLRSLLDPVLGHGNLGHHRQGTVGKCQPATKSRNIKHRSTAEIANVFGGD